MYGNLTKRLISLKDDDFAPCYFLLWEYQKSMVYIERPRTLVHLNENIGQAIAGIPITILDRVKRNLRNRVSQCINNEGRYFSDITFNPV